MVASVILPIACVPFALSGALMDNGVLWGLYIAPVCVAAPLWLRLRLSDAGARRPARWVLDILIVFAAASRLVGNYVPASGHMLFLTYSALTTTPKWYRAFAAVLLVVATVFKLAVAGDTQGWTVGLAMGLVAAVVYRRIDPRRARLGRAEEAT